MSPLSGLDGQQNEQIEKENRSQDVEAGSEGAGIGGVRDNRPPWWRSSPRARWRAEKAAASNAQVRAELRYTGKIRAIHNQVTGKVCEFGLDVVKGFQEHVDRRARSLFTQRFYQLPILS
jgi:hypothetical protein